MSLSVSAASLLFQPGLQNTGRTPQAPSLAAIASGHGAAKGIKASGSLFDPGRQDVSKLKVNLYERVGKVFGIAMDDYDSLSSYGAAIRQEVSNLVRQHGAAVLTGIEKQLGLDKLGVSLMTVIGAMTDPGSDDERRLTDALRASLGDTDDKHEGRSRAEDDGIGLYSPR